jgi:hypothetical protein
MRTPRRPLRLILGAALLSVAGGILVALGRSPTETPPPSNPDAVERIAATYRACGQDDDCITGRLSSIVNAEPVEAVTTVRDLFAGPTTNGEGCHWALHLVGQMLKPRILTGDKLGLGDLWSSCGYAVLHGAFEDIPLDGGVRDIGREAFAVCVNGVLERERVGQCYHPIGHTIEMNLPADIGAPHLLLAEAACAEGAWSVAGTYPTATGLKACVSGAHMRHRDAVVRPGNSLARDAGQTWGDVLPQCERSLFPYACITLYMENVLPGPDEEATTERQSLRDWCVDTSPEAAEVCGYFYGMTLDRAAPFAGKEVLVPLCAGGGAAERVVLSCIRGVLDDLGGVPGRSATPQESVCDQVGTLAETCREAARIAVTYPPLASLEENLLRRGKTLPPGV